MSFDLALSSRLAMHTPLYKDTASHGDRYPLDTDCYAPTGEDRSLCNQTLSEESRELFQIADGGVNVLWSTQDNGSALDLAEFFK